MSSSIRREEIISNARTNWELIRQANILSLGSQQRQNTHHQQQLQAARKFGNAKPPAASKLTPNNSSSSNSTTASSNNIEGRTMKSSLASRQIIDVAKRQKSKLLKSLSAENSSLVSSTTTAAGELTDIECEYFHLPPVLDEHFAEKCTSTGNKNQSAASSTRPNIDSESSAFSSDTDDQKSFKSKIPTTPPIQPPKAVSQASTPIETIIIREGEMTSGEDGVGREKATTSSFVSVTNSSLLPSLTEIERQPVAVTATAMLDSTEMTTSLVNGNVSSKITAGSAETMRRNETVIQDDDEQLSRLPRRRSPSPITIKSSVDSKTPAIVTIIDNNNSNANGISLQPSTATITAEIAPPASISTLSNELKLVEATTDAAASLMISKASAAKASCDSINTISSIQDERHAHASHAAAASTTSHHHHNTNSSNNNTRSRSHSRKLGPPLVRSQTARNLSSQINSGNSAAVSSTNQQSSGANSAGVNAVSNQSQVNSSGSNQKKESKKETDKDRETGEKLFRRNLFSLFFLSQSPHIFSLRGEVKKG